MKFFILLLSILYVSVYSNKILERAHWASTLRHTNSDNPRLKALDNSKQLDVKIQGKGEGRIFQQKLHKNHKGDHVSFKVN